MWDTKRISNFLNSNNFNAYSGLEWAPNLVYMNRQKYLKRLKDYKIINVKTFSNWLIKILRI